VDKLGEPRGSYAVEVRNRSGALQPGYRIEEGWSYRIERMNPPGTQETGDQALKSRGNEARPVLNRSALHPLELVGIKGERDTWKCNVMLRPDTAREALIAEVARLTGGIRKGYELAMKDKEGTPQEEFRVAQGWTYRIYENTEAKRKETEKWKSYVTVETRFGREAKSMEVCRTWNRDQMHEELKRRWGLRGARTEMIMKRQGIVQREFGAGEGWTYELRVLPEVQVRGVDIW
jgi:hypothetical protein